jgi:hypothetical protein
VEAGRWHVGLEVFEGVVRRQGVSIGFTQKAKSSFRTGKEI